MLLTITNMLAAQMMSNQAQTQFVQVFAGFGELRLGDRGAVAIPPPTSTTDFPTVTSPTHDDGKTQYHLRIAVQANDQKVGGGDFPTFDAGAYSLVYYFYSQDEAIVHYGLLDSSGLITDLGFAAENY